MALSRTDKKMIAFGAGMFGGGQVVNKASGGQGPVGTSGSAASIVGVSALGYVGAGEIVEQIGLGTRAVVGHHAKDIFSTIKTGINKSQQMLERDTDVARRVIKSGLSGIL